MHQSPCETTNKAKWQIDSVDYAIIYWKTFKRTFFGGSSSMTTVASLRAASSLTSSLALPCCSSSSATTCLVFLKSAGIVRLNFFVCALAALTSALSVSLLLDTNTLNGSQLQYAYGDGGGWFGGVFILLVFVCVRACVWFTEKDRHTSTRPPGPHAADR